MEKTTSFFYEQPDMSIIYSRVLDAILVNSITPIPEDGETFDF